MANVNEIATKLHLSVEQVNTSPSIQNTYMEIENNPNMSPEEKDAAFEEMANILKDMLASKK